MKSAFWRVVALAMIVALVPSVAFAGGEVARSAMSGTNFMNTSADTWILFHRSMDGEGFGEFVSEGYNGLSNKGTFTHNEGQGRLILPFGDYRLGFEINDSATGSNLVDYAWGGAPYMRRFTIGDFIETLGPTGNSGFHHGQLATAKIAGSMGGGGGWSAGAGYYNNSFEDKEANNKDTSTGFSFNGSWGNGAPSTQGTIELAAEFTLHSDKREDTTPAVDEIELSGNHIGAYGRYSLSDDSHLEGGIALLSSDLDDNGSTATYGLTAFRANYARDLVEETDHGAVLEVGIDFLSSKIEPDGGEDITESTFSVPTARFSAWHQLVGNFTLFGGVTGSWYTGSSEDGNVPEEFSGSEDTFSWTTGLGWTPNDHIAIELFLLTQNLDQVMSLGNQAPLIGGIGAHGSW